MIPEEERLTKLRTARDLFNKHGSTWEVSSIINDANRIIIGANNQKKEYKMKKMETKKVIETFTRDCERIRAAIRALIAVILKELRKPCLRLCRLIDTTIEDFSRRYEIK